MKTTTKKQTSGALTGLESVRVRAKLQNSVRFIKADSGDARITWSDIRTLKSFETEVPDEPEASDEPFILKMWHQFQEALGNR